MISLSGSSRDAPGAFAIALSCRKRSDGGMLGAGAAVVPCNFFDIIFLDITHRDAEGVDCS